jgi:hypothetical protein
MNITQSRRVHVQTYKRINSDDDDITKALKYKVLAHSWKFWQSCSLFCRLESRQRLAVKELLVVNYCLTPLV